MSSPLTIGTDPIAPPATAGYALNHFALVVVDVAAMRHFYGTVLGMRHIMTFQVSPTYDVTYMGYPVGPSGFQTGEEMHHDLRCRDGLIEFLHPSGPTAASQTDLDKRAGRLSHLGIVVPDVHAGEERLREFDVPVLKALGDDAIEPGSAIAEWWSLDHAQAAQASVGAKGMGWAGILIVNIPERNIVEMQRK